MLQLWRAARPAGGLFGAGSGHLPDAGGMLDQAVIMLQAFNVMDAADYAIAQLDKPAGTGEPPRGENQ